jgi:uncharacterized protein YndB with AHSA1/START domain
MSRMTLFREENSRASADQVWQALTDPAVTVQYVFGRARVQSTWRPATRSLIFSPDGTVRAREGTLLQVEPQRHLVVTCLLLWNPELAADSPHRETFEIEEMGDICTRTSTFNQYTSGSPAYQPCGIARTASSLKSLLETGQALTFPDKRGQSALCGHKLHRFPRQVQPFLVGRWRDGNPLLHEPAIMTRIEAHPVSRGDERIDPPPRELDDERARGEHGEDPATHLQGR